MPNLLGVQLLTPPELLRLVRDTLVPYEDDLNQLPADSTTGTSPRRKLVYISRSPHESRSVVNEAEVVEALRPLAKSFGLELELFDGKREPETFAAPDLRTTTTDH